MTLTLKAGSQELFSDSRTTFSLSQSPSATTLYTFSAACQGLSQTATTTVTVTPSPPSYYEVVFSNGPFENPAYPSQGESFTLTLNFTNIGNQPSPEYVVNLTVDGGAAMPQNLQSLSPGQTGTVPWQIPPLSDDVHEFSWSIPATGAGNGFEIPTF